ncbi:MAG: histidine phosphatase family protein [Bacilli bacterium]
MIYLVRHGQTEWNADGDRFCGSADIPLSSAGLLQAQRLGRVLGAVSLTAVYHSGMQRSRDTAAAIVREQGGAGGAGGSALDRDSADHAVAVISLAGRESPAVAQETNTALMEERDFREVDFGAWEGLSKQQAAVRDPQVYAAWLSQPGTTAIPGAAQAAAAAQRRALAAIRRVAARHGAEHVAIVGHSTLNRLLLTGLLDAPVDSYRRIVQYNACVNMIAVHGDAVHIYGVNMTTLPTAF